jgi:hypothetical protein
LATATKQRRRTAEVARRKNASHARVAEFALGSLETELSAIGRAVPAREWAKVPADYFANLDHYLHSAPRKAALKECAESG